MAFEDLQRAPASKLFPLVRVLLQADSLTETGDAATLSALAPGKVAPGISRGLSHDSGVVWASLQRPSACTSTLTESQRETGTAPRCCHWACWADARSRRSSRVQLGCAGRVLLKLAVMWYQGVAVAGMLGLPHVTEDNANVRHSLRQLQCCTPSRRGACQWQAS